jgi:hypothetical protein
MQNRNSKVENGTSASLEQNGLLADVLSVQEAIQAMYDGKKVTHRFLTQEKFMKLTDTLYEFADGRKCDPVLFWKLRGLHKEWLTGWSLYVG